MFIQAMTLEHVPGAVALQRASFPPPFPEELLWKAEHLARHIELFPEGQYVAVDVDGEVWASATSVILREDRYQLHASWDDTIGGPYLTAHDPNGTTLYGVDISVHPEARRQGIGRRLYHARYMLTRQLGLKRYATACRVPDFGAWRTQPTNLVDDLDRYIVLVERDEVQDRTLTPLLHMGLDPVAGIVDYMDDAESLNCAALLEWLPEQQDELWSDEAPELAEST